MANIVNQKTLTGAVIGGTLKTGTGEFSGTDKTGELDVAGMTTVLSATLTPIKPSTSVQTAGMGTVAVTAYIDIVLPRIRGSISAIKVTPASTVAVNDTNYWTVGAVNRGTDGDGTAVVVDATAAANSTKATSGAAFTAATKRTMTLTSTSADLVVTEGQTIRITLTKAAAATTLGAVTVEITVTGSALGTDEILYLDELVDNGQITVPSTGKITVARTGASPSTDLPFSFSVIGY
jgi:hypothetical protein